MCTSCHINESQVFSVCLLFIYIIREIKMWTKLYKTITPATFEIGERRHTCDRNTKVREIKVHVL